MPLEDAVVETSEDVECEGGVGVGGEVDAADGVDWDVEGERDVTADSGVWIKMGRDRGGFPFLVVSWLFPGMVGRGGCL